MLSVDNAMLCDVVRRQCGTMGYGLWSTRCDGMWSVDNRSISSISNTFLMLLLEDLWLSFKNFKQLTTLFVCST